jgi:DNA (cytosine-5)-methyltransferase 1
MTSDVEQAISRKLTRLQRGDKPRVLDLFSGCGGLSLGFKAAGFEIAAAVEIDPDAAASHGFNFHRDDARHSVARDITTTSPAALTDALGLQDPAHAFDVLVGGPPCQAFARVGRSKLREIAEHPEAFRHDARAQLYIEYLSYVEACAPLAVVMENVPDMLNHGGHNIAEDVADVLERKGYVCRYSLLNAAYYGVPQMRERMILIAIREEVATEVRMPSPTNWVDLPSGYNGTRAVALKGLERQALLFRKSRYSEAPRASRELPPAVTARDALGDLPAIYAQQQLEAGSLRRGRRAFDVAVPYGTTGEQNGYPGTMRTWRDYEGGPALYDHVIRYLPRDYQLFAGLKPGDQYPEAKRFALSLFEKRVEERRRASDPIEENSEEWDRLRASIVPPYDEGKFPNKWRKMEADHPARTLMAHLGKDSYSHIHYDSDQARTISVREAARLQSFPDGFAFRGTMNPAFRQIGNAVPPLFAKQIGLCLRGQLPKAAQDTDFRRASGGNKQ